MTARRDSQKGMDMDRIGVIFGGNSSEYEISLMSAKAVLEAVDRSKHDIVMIGLTRSGEWKKYEGTLEKIESDEWANEAEPVRIDDLPELIDFALPIMHGAYGEDGKIQGLFEMLGIPYAGCGVLASSLAMDKVAAKQVFEAAGIPTCAYRLVTGDAIREHVSWEAVLCESRLHYPMFVKPANAGSSVGITKVHDRDELMEGMRTAAKYDRRVIVEEGLDAREIETGVIGNEIPEAAACGEIQPAKEFYDYTAKYSSDAGTVLTVPAQIDHALENDIRSIAVDTYRALDCAGFARIDFLVDRKTGKPFVNEVNTIPGFTRFSMFPTVWAEKGVPFTELIERIVEYGYERHRSEDHR